MKANIQKHETQKSDVERFPLRKLNELQVMKQYQIEITNRLTALEEIDGVWENIKENIKTSEEESTGLYGLNQHKPWFNEEC